MRYLAFVLVSLLITLGCKINVEGTDPPPQLQQAQSSGEATPVSIYVADTGQDSINVGLTGGNVEGHHYTISFSQTPEQKKLTSTLLGQQLFMMRVLEKEGSRLFSKLAQNPATARKLQEVGMRLLSNKNLVNSLLKADGVDMAQVTTQVAALVTAIGTLDNAKTTQEENNARIKINNALYDLSVNRNLMAAIMSALAKEGDFLAQVLLEENLISGILGQKDFIAELMKYDEGKILSQIIDIPLALKKIEEIVAVLLANEELMRALVVPEDDEKFVQLVTNLHELTNEIIFAEGQISADRIKVKILEVMKSLTENEELFATIFTALFKDLGIGSAPLTSNWAQTNTPTITLGRGLPSPTSTDKMVEINVSTSDRSLAGYRYSILHDVGLCPSAAKSYTGNVVSFQRPITATIRHPGLKTLCVFGVNDEHELSSLIVSYSWFYSDSMPFKMQGADRK